MPQFRFTENTPRGPITVEANDDEEAISLILSRMKSMGDSHHVVSGTLSDQSGRIEEFLSQAMDNSHTPAGWLCADTGKHSVTPFPPLGEAIELYRENNPRLG